MMTMVPRARLAKQLIAIHELPVTERQPD